MRVCGGAHIGGQDSRGGVRDRPLSEAHDEDDFHIADQGALEPKVQRLQAKV